MNLLSILAGPLAARLLRFEDVDFATPVGEPAIVPPDSVSWEVFSSPLSVYIGGVAAVLLEFGEPRVREGVWRHSRFHEDPRRRMHSTGAAAMLTAFGARSRAEALARQINALHATVAGTTPDGRPYRADDPELLLWVQATASYAFLEAYCRFVRPLDRAERDAFYAEAAVGARLYAVREAPQSEADVAALFDRTLPRLEPSPVLGEFLRIMRDGAILPLPLRSLQRLVVSAAIDLLPPRLAEATALDCEPGLTRVQRRLLTRLARTAAELAIPDSPWAQACRRLGLPPLCARRRR